MYFILFLIIYIYFFLFFIKAISTAGLTVKQTPWGGKGRSGRSKDKYIFFYHIFCRKQSMLGDNKIHHVCQYVCMFSFSICTSKGKGVITTVRSNGGGGAWSWNHFRNQPIAGLTTFSLSIHDLGRSCCLAGTSREHNNQKKVVAAWNRGFKVFQAYVSFLQWQFSRVVVSLPPCSTKCK